MQKHQKSKRIIPGPAGNCNSSPIATQSQKRLTQYHQGSPTDPKVLKRKAPSGAILNQKLKLANENQNIFDANIRKYAKLLRRSTAWKIARETMGDRLQQCTTIESIYTETDKYRVENTLLYIKSITLKPSYSLESSRCSLIDHTGEIKATLDKSFVDLIEENEPLIGIVVELENVSILRLDYHPPHLVFYDYHLKALFTPDCKKKIFHQIENHEKGSFKESQNIMKRRLTMKDVQKYHAAEQQENRAPDLDETKDTQISTTHDFDENDLLGLLKGIDDFDENDLF